MSTATVRIVLVDDHAVVRGGIRRLLEELDEFTVVGEAGTVDEALTVCQEQRPDVIVLDLGLGDRSSLEILPALVEVSRVVVLSMQHQPAYAQLAFERGATAYVLKDAADAELIQAIQVVLDGGSYVHPTLAAKLAAGGDDDLTGREREILRAIALGHTNQEIAGQMHLSVRTIEAHRRHIATKLRLTTRAELSRYAREHGLLDLGLNP